MRMGLFIAGIILIIGGVMAWMGQFEYTKDKHVASIGNLASIRKALIADADVGWNEGEGGPGRFARRGAARDRVHGRRSLASELERHRLGGIPRRAAVHRGADQHL